MPLQPRVITASVTSVVHKDIFSRKWTHGKKGGLKAAAGTRACCEPCSVNMHAFEKKTAFFSFSVTRACACAASDVASRTSATETNSVLERREREKNGQVSEL